MAASYVCRSRLAPSAAASGKLVPCVEIGAKRPADAIKTLQRAIAAGNQQPAVHYNLACAFAQASRADALASLETAVANGYTGAKEMAEDADLAPLRGQPRFEALLQKLR